MSTIFLVCTVHEETGSANASQLHMILSAINPDVVFLEVPSEVTDFQIIPDMKNNLESKAISLFKTDGVKLVPVDLPTPNRDFFENYEQVHREAEAKSLKYRQLVDAYSVRLRKHGFYYLNSEICSNDLLEINKEIEEKLDSSENINLNNYYTTWLNQISLRDLAMYKNITRYCGENSFNIGVFLVGAAHRDGIIKESKGSGIDWNYDGKGYWYPQNNT